MDKTFEKFVEDVRALIDGNAQDKGYNTTGPDGRNDLYRFISGFAGPHHAIGEIIYKSVRYNARGNIQDILKIAAWAYLVYKHHGPAVLDETTK